LSTGEWLGLSGASGAGKTTVADLVSGLFSPDQGQVTVDGERLEGPLLERWRCGLAYVGQTDMVFNDSVRGNLLAEGARADDEALWAALETVGLGPRFRRVTEGLDTPIGDRGSSLSGGERQRLVLARSLLRRSSLLILDEATNALDPASEMEVLARLRGLTPRPAALLIAHRRAPLELCDRVLTISQGIDAADDA
jgi:ATP-binding cassette subfamily C protein